MSPLIHHQRRHNERSSSLPPDEDRSSSSLAVATSRDNRGRERNPIGLSRQSSSFYDRSSTSNTNDTNNNSNNNDTNNNKRSQSLTRRNSFSDVRRKRSSSLQQRTSSLLLLKRTDSTSSFTSVNSNNTSNVSISEPMWFAHAFHGSGACTCGLDHDLFGNCDTNNDATATNNASNAGENDRSEGGNNVGDDKVVEVANVENEGEGPIESNNNIDSNANTNNNNNEEEDGIINRQDTNKSNITIYQHSDAELLSESNSNNNNNDSFFIDNHHNNSSNSSSRLLLLDKKDQSNSGLDNDTDDDVTTSVNSSSGEIYNNNSNNNNNDARGEKDDYNNINNSSAVYTTTTTTTTSSSGSIGEESTMDGEKGSIQSELLGPGVDRVSSMRYQPKKYHNNKNNNDNESCVSSITMDYIPHPNVTLVGSSSRTTTQVKNNNNKPSNNKKSKSFVGNMKDKISRKKNKSKSSFQQHGGDMLGNSMDELDKSENSLNNSSTMDGGEERGGSGGGRRRGRSLGLRRKKHTATQPAVGNNNNNNSSSSNPHPYNDDGNDDRRVRERSRSIVKDALHFMETMESPRSCDEYDDDDDSQQQRQQQQDVVTESSMNATSRKKKNKNNNKKKDNEEALREIQELHARRRISLESTSTSTSATSSKASSVEVIQQAEKTIELLSTLQETNTSHENTITQLQLELKDVIGERNALRSNSERILDKMTQQKTMLELELKKERKGFADVTHSHKKEIDRMERKYKKLEDELLNNTNKNKSSKQQQQQQSSSSNVGGSEEITLLRNKLSEMEIRHKEELHQIQQLDNNNNNNNVWKIKFDELNKHHQDMLNERNEEVAIVNALENKLEGCRIVIESMKKNEQQQLQQQSSSSNNNATTTTPSSSSDSGVNDELVEKIGDLADANGQLLIKCQQLEWELQQQQQQQQQKEQPSNSTSSTTSQQELESNKEVQALTNELQACQFQYNDVLSTIDTLRAENRTLRTCLVTQGQTSMKKMKRMVCKLRNSLVTSNSVNAESSSSSDEIMIEEDDNDDDYHDKSNMIMMTNDTDINHEEAMSIIQSIQTENDTLYGSMEETILQLLSTSNKKDDLSNKVDLLMKENKKLSMELEQVNTMAMVSSVRDEIVQEQLLSKETWDKEKRELSIAMDNLKLENDRLHTSMMEMNSLVATAEECVDKLTQENVSLKNTNEYYEQKWNELNDAKESNEYLREEIKSITTEREEAYDTCKVLQQEINVLRKSVKESKGRIERLSFDSDGRCDISADNDDGDSQGKKEKLAELIKVNESLSKELEQKNTALQAVQSALESLKEEQSTIKETIVDLRTENAKLQTQHQQTQMVLALPPPPKSSSSKSKQMVTFDRGGDGSDSSIIMKLESSIKKVNKENKGLKEANNTLSAKLFDEMEKTDALRVANEGLAARICKLVAFIQQNPSNSSGSGGGGGGGATSSSSNGGGGGGRSGSRRRSKSPARPKKKK